MYCQLFQDAPDVPLLQWLARGSLKKNLVRAVRLWVWLRLLYGDERLSLSPSFTYAMWREAFFSPTHPKGEAVPELHDPNCPCARTIASWLFNPSMNVSEETWRRSLQQHNAMPENLDNLLQQRLFAVTRRSLAEDLQILAKLSWLRRNDRTFNLVDTLPTRPLVSTDESMEEAKLAAYELNFLHPDLAAIAANYSQQINNTQRFFLHVNYVVPAQMIDQVDDCLERLRQLWQQNPVPPVRLIYKSIRLNQDIECVVYPVCIYYMQRATFLCALGRNPNGEENWYNYRLDRIEELNSLSWTDARIPELLLQQYQDNKLPTPDYIQEQMAKAWGFNFYQNTSQLLLRFDRLYNQRYIQGTVEHETFQQVSYEQALSFIKKLTSPEQQKILLAILKSRSPEDAYYTAYYREGDPSVEMRLRAWRPNVEVLFPWTLRQSFANEVLHEWQFYYWEDNPYIAKAEQRKEDGTKQINYHQELKSPIVLAGAISVEDKIHEWMTATFIGNRIFRNPSDFPSFILEYPSGLKTGIGVEFSRQDISIYRLKYLLLAFRANQHRLNLVSLQLILVTDDERVVCQWEANFAEKLFQLRDIVELRGEVILTTGYLPLNGLFQTRRNISF